MHTTTTRRGANHGLHLFLSIITFGMWAVTGWPIAAAMGRRQTVTHHGASPAWSGIPVRPGHPAYQAPQQPNAVNPYNGQAYYDPWQQGARR